MAVMTIARKKDLCASFGVQFLITAFWCFLEIIAAARHIPIPVTAPASSSRVPCPPVFGSSVLSPHCAYKVTVLPLSSERFSTDAPSLYAVPLPFFVSVDIAIYFISTQKEFSVCEYVVVIGASAVITGEVSCRLDCPVKDRAGRCEGYLSSGKHIAIHCQAAAQIQIHVTVGTDITIFEGYPTCDQI